MALYRRTLTYVSMPDFLLAVNEQNAVCGLLIGLDDKLLGRKLKTYSKPPRAFERHMVNGQPKPIGDYFTKVH